MSSIPSEDKSCMMSASEMSCQAMTLLAKQEAERNQGVMFRQVLHPACEKFQQLADRAEEYVLQKPSVFGKKMCFSQTENYQDGPWKDQFKPLTSLQASFDTWSRRKGV